MLPYNPRLKQISRHLRREMTDAEQSLWRKLRGKQILGVQFYRQKPIGEYIVDFFAPVASLVIEVDGSQHFEPAAVRHDGARTDYLQRCGLRMLRFDNRQVLLETDAVMDRIFDIVREQLGKTNPP